MVAANGGAEEYLRTRVKSDRSIFSTHYATANKLTTIPVMKVWQTPLPPIYNELSEPELRVRIASAKETLGEKLVILLHRIWITQDIYEPLRGVVVKSTAA